MTIPKLLPLSEVDIRDAWKHEAQQFTPWLADNIHFLSDEIGLELELIEMEHAVDEFSVDILAQDSNGDRVVIENQLEASDHRHLGQVLTYLTGTEAKYVIWITRKFRDAHASAVRWLNEHTDERFSFFAVQVSVVRIGNSPFAPRFKIIEKPNDWDTSLRGKTTVAESKFTKLRRRFWNRYLEKYPSSIRQSAHSNIRMPMGSKGEVLLSLYLARNRSGIYLRGPLGSDKENFVAWVAQHEEVLQSDLGPGHWTQSHRHFGYTKEISIHEESRWDELIDWLEERRQYYLEVFNAIESSENN